jgi:hypothetical protein
MDPVNTGNSSVRMLLRAIWYRHDNIACASLGQTLQRMAEDGLAFPLRKLLGKGLSSAQALSGSHDDR